MTFPAITTDGQTHTTGGVKYTSILLEQRWRRTALVPLYGESSVVEFMLSNGAITPAKINLAVLFATTPPGTPSVGPKYLVRATATGAWAGHENSIATWSGSAWVFTTPVEGMIVWDGTADKLYCYNGTAWVVANEYTLPDRLNAGGELVTDWDNAVLNGFYYAVPGATNAPNALLFTFGIVQQLASANSVDQTVTVWDGINSTSLTYSRQLYAGSWTAWVARNLTSSEVSALITAAVTAYVATPEKAKFSVISRATSNPPGSPTNGDRYIIPTSATGVWLSHPKELAVWDGTAAAWVYTALTEGVPFWVADEDKWIVYNGTDFVIVGPQPNNEAFQFQYRLVDATGAVFGPLNTSTDYAGQPWTTVFAAANLGAGVPYYGLANATGAGAANANVGPEATAIRVAGQNYWLFSASYNASVSPYAPGDDEPSIGF